MEDIKKLQPRAFTRFCMSIGAVPSSYLAGLTIEEQLLWFCSYLEKEVIPAVNNNAGAVEELQALYTQLQEYVNTYFDNLDVQEEINNKLDAMAESGELESIISAYLQTKAVFGFDTVADMKNGENLQDGTYVQTLGFYSKGDGGNAIYKIRNITNDDVIDESTIIEINDSSNQLIAELINKSNLNSMQFGVQISESVDLGPKLQIAIDYASTKSVDKKLTLANGTYVMETSCIIPQNLSFDGSFAKIKSKINNGCMFGLNTNQAMTTWIQGWPVNQHVIRNLEVVPFDNTITTGSVFMIGGTVRFENIRIWKMYNSFQQINNYVDAKAFINVYVQEGIGDYDCSLGLGDGLNIDQCTEMRFKVHDSAGVVIKNCLNLGLEFTSVKGCTVSGLHNEFPYPIILKGCNLTIEDSYLTRRTALDELIKIETHDHSASSIVIRNSAIMYYSEHGFDSSRIYNDLNIGWGNTVTIENVYRASTYFGGGFDEFTTQICVNNNIVNPLYNKYRIENGKKIVPLEYNKNLFETNWTLESVNQAGAENIGHYTTSDGTLYFTIIEYLDTTRLIKAPSQNRNTRNITINGNNNVVYFALNKEQIISNSILRVYRGASSGNYNSICDVPIYNPTNLLWDNKLTIGNVAKWRDIGTDTFNSGITAFNYQNEGTNVVIKASAIPTVGTWTKGDVIINSNPSAGGAYGWICTASGTPGTWKAISNIVS